MRRYLLVFLVAAACGGKQQKSTTPPPPLPEATAEVKPEAPKEEPKEEKPPVPEGPVELTVTAPEVNVKLVSPGKGKKVPLKHTSKAGDKQAIELAMDFTGKQSMDGGKAEEQVAPTVVLLADVETKEVAADGSTKFQLTVTGVDARDVAGAKTPGAEFKQDLLSLTGATIEGSVNPNGKVSDLTMRVEKPDAHTIGAMNLIKLSLMPIWPVLPNEAIAPGAKWTVTQNTKVADRLEVTQTTNYQLVSTKGNLSTIKGTMKVTGTEQDIEGAKFGAIAGEGSTEVTLNRGALLPSAKQQVKTDFTATAEQPASAQGPAQKVSLVFHLEQGNTVTPK